MVHHITTKFDISWAQVKRVFHEHFIRKETKVSVIDLTTTKHFNSETIEDYLNRFRQMKSQCYIQIHEHELVKMHVVGLMKKLEIRHN